MPNSPEVTLSDAHPSMHALRLAGPKPRTFEALQIFQVCLHILMPYPQHQPSGNLMPSSQPLDCIHLLPSTISPFQCLNKQTAARSALGHFDLRGQLYRPADSLQFGHGVVFPPVQLRLGIGAALSTARTFRDRALRVFSSICCPTEAQLR